MTSVSSRIQLLSRSLSRLTLCRSPLLWPFPGGQLPAPIHSSLHTTLYGWRWEVLCAFMNNACQQPYCGHAASCSLCGCQCSYQLYPGKDEQCQGHGAAGQASAQCCGLVMHCGHTAATNCVGQRFPLPNGPRHCAPHSHAPICQAAAAAAGCSGCVRQSRHAGSAPHALR